MIYLDNAATTWPKPTSVVTEMARFMEECGSSPGRGGHRLARKSRKLVEETRAALSRLFHTEAPEDIWFCLNGTHAINQVCKGWLRPGDHVLTSSWEHHAVARPLAMLQHEIGIKVTHVPPTSSGLIDMDAMEKAITPDTNLIAMTHASNVTGAILPIEEVGEIARHFGIPLLVDAAQTAGRIPIDVQALPIDFLTFPGHKGLFGPQGTGGLYVRPGISLSPLLQGGTGNRSEELTPLNERPYSYESGTQNAPGIVGWRAGLRFLEEKGVEAIHQKELDLIARVRTRLQDLDGVNLYLPPSQNVAILSFNMDGVASEEIATVLDQEYDIAVRSGFHCAPIAHQSNGTGMNGTVRVSPGYFTTDKEIDAFIQAIEEIHREFAGW
ncbi:aminotransferase class V-fold PLP-dependent enzyme [Marininema halotolerans]|uniref:aminotransferase class V-fold PLP-dependent enzyme n=1 Tax=Marininema halotolerans TaxID=1155944 RepID=UPI001FE3CBD9|nr:aminotransferase class V-fold PLP-dependent enzyme [Marininema halotolerans]